MKRILIRCGNNHGYSANFYALYAYMCAFVSRQPRNEDVDTLSFFCQLVCSLSLFLNPLT